MANELNGLRVAFVTSNEGVEQVELTEPWKAVSDAGGGHLPRAVDPRRGRSRARPDAHVLAEP